MKKETTTKILDALRMKTVPGWAKGIAIIVIIIFVAWLAYQFYKSAQDRELAAAFRKDKDMLYDKGERPTFNRTQYATFADKLYAASQAQNITGTQEDAIYDVFEQMKNEMDIVLLTEAFGQKRLSFSFRDAGLGGYLTDELDQDELDIINAKLAKKGINSRF